MAFALQSSVAPNYHGNTDPHIFLMCYEAAKTLAGGHEGILANSLIISLEDAAINWYSRHPPRCIYSWQQLKDEFLLHFHGVQAEHDTKEDFLSCTQREKETLPNFYQRFLQLKTQAPEVSDEQVIAQAIKALRAGPLENQVVREQSKTLSEHYEQFRKFSNSEVQHFRRLEQQRKVAKSDKITRPQYNV
jgi:hypothetical protein